MVQRMLLYRRGREAFEKVVDSPFDVGVVPDVSLCSWLFDRWLVYYNFGYFVRMRGEFDFCFIRMVNRFQDMYVRRVKRKLKCLYLGGWDFMVTLTMRPLGMLCDEFTYIAQQFPRVRAWLFKRFGHFSYIRILEVTKVGRPHLHLLLRLSDDFKKGIPLDWCRIDTESIYEDSSSGGVRLVMQGLRDVWGMFVKVRRPWKSFRCVSYVMKYLFKTLECKSQFDRRFGALLWVSNMRLWSVSRDLLPVRPRVEKPKVPVRKYVYDGLVRKSEFEYFLREQKVELEKDFYRLSEVKGECWDGVFGRGEWCREGS